MFLTIYRRVKWLRDVDSNHDGEAYETSPVAQPSRDCGLNEKMVDRRGFAPRSSACKAGDLLNDRAARKRGCALCEAAPLVVAEEGIEPTHGGL